MSRCGGKGGVKDWNIIMTRRVGKDSSGTYVSRCGGKLDHGEECKVCSELNLLIMTLGEFLQTTVYTRAPYSSMLL
jgi:hypothetical protein